MEDDEKENFNKEFLEEFLGLVKQKPIPKLFHSIFEDGPFTRCTDSDVSLQEEGGIYSVQKVYRKGEVIMEVALSEQSKHELVTSYSSESLENLVEFSSENRIYKATIEFCNFCGTPQPELEEYTIGADFYKAVMLEAENPFLICIDCFARLDELLSAHTRDIRDGFMERNFPGPPSDAVLDDTPPKAVMC